MTDADQTAEKDLVGVKGWLVFYVIMEIANILLTVTDELTLTDFGGLGLHYYFIEILLTSGSVIGLYLIFYVRKPITRTYNIWFNLFWAVSVMLDTVQAGFALVQALGLVIAPLWWAAYWRRSKRVRATYCQETVQDS